MGKFDLARSGLENEVFVSVIVEFCMLLMAGMVIWLFFQAVNYADRRLAFRKHMKSFYKGLADGPNKDGFAEYVSNGFQRLKGLKGMPLENLFTGLLSICKNFRESRNRVRYIISVNEMRIGAHETFTRKNSRSLAIQVVSALFALMVFLGERPLTGAHIEPMRFVIIGVFLVFSVGIFISRERTGNRAANEIDKLEKVYEKNLKSI